MVFGVFALGLGYESSCILCLSGEHRVLSLGTLRLSEGVVMQEFPQSVGRLTQLAQNLHELIRHGNLLVYPDEELRRHISHAVAIEFSRGWGLDKTLCGHKIDLEAAL